MLYSTPDGQRKLRILNLYLPVQDRMDNLFKMADQEAILQFLIKQQLGQLHKFSAVRMRQNLINSTANILRVY